MSHEGQKSDQSPALESPWSPPEELIELAREAGAEIITELLGAFQEDSAARLQVLRDAIRNQDGVLIRGEAHALKGSAAQIGAVEFAACCAEMERLAQNGVPSEQSVLLARAEAEFARLQQQFSALATDGAS